jgi:HSP20 family protein
MNELSTLPLKGQAEQGGPERARGDVYFTPRVDVYETDQELVLYADVPGVKPEDVALRYENGELLLHGRVRRPRAERLLVLNEYDEGDYFRTFGIHESIDSTRITAECKDGVLTVHLPKAEAVKPKQIAVHGPTSAKVAAASDEDAEGMLTTKSKGTFAACPASALVPGSGGEVPWDVVGGNCDAALRPSPGGSCT